jgi:hypothetical protein
MWGGVGCVWERCWGVCGGVGGMCVNVWCVYRNTVEPLIIGTCK